MRNGFLNYLMAAVTFIGVIFITSTLSACAAFSQPEDIEICESTVADYGGGTAVDPEPSEIQSKPSIFVYICGRVARPGVYEMEQGSRLYQLLDRCGGLTTGADAGDLNQARLLSDGEKVLVRAVGERPDTTDSGSDESDGLVNINTADSAALMTIPGIGAARAADIIAYRESSGGFSSVEDIKKVNGIKDGLYSRIKDHIKV
ncbi:MAG: ComEA family DNA-binding protein [Lachnospiraceae bacterium]|nr:ComEA family DNA-binding protein [Lachnospiraceae bacterium]